MLLNLAGLIILRIEGDGFARGEPDLVWRHRSVSSLPGGACPDSPFTAVRPDRLGTELTFGRGGRMRCRFVVGPGGRTVESWSVAGVSDRDLLALFGEHILRTILVRRGLTSFHAASLSDREGAILVMGDKGRGKSTLSSALQQRGWSCVADDLTRVAEDADGAWRAFAGLREIKLLPDSIAALGLACDALPPRWDDASGAGGDKRLLAPRGEPRFAAPALRLRAVLVLQARGEGLAHRVASPVQAVRALLDHATADPLDPGAPPPAAVQRAVGALVRSVPVIELALPDRLDALGVSAEAVETLVRRTDARRAA